MASVLTIGNSGVAEVAAFAAVLSDLRARGHDALLFKQDRCVDGDDFISFEMKSGVSHTYIVIDGEPHDLAAFDSVWYLKPLAPKSVMLYEPAEYRALLQKQLFTVRQALWSVCSDKRWISDPWAVERAENKIHQLHVASALGFSVPDTVVTSDPATVRSFYREKGGKVVVKLLATAPVYGRAIFTNRLQERDLEDLDGLRLAPAIFQEYVAKSHELRITVVGSQVFAAAIDSQADEATAVDWRRRPSDPSAPRVAMRATTLPAAVTTRVLDLVRTLGLDFGCVDMVVTPSDEYVFLEINPNGQWHFVQLGTGIEISRAISHALA